MSHLVLQVPVPALEPFVRARTAHHDPAYVSGDPTFGHAHVTALGPWLDDPGAADLALVAAIAATTAPFDYVLDDLHVFPDGIIHLRPAPEAPFRELTRRLWEAFPACPPYGGAFGLDDVQPHLTLESTTTSSVDEVRTLLTAALPEGLPVSCRAEVLELARWGARSCSRVSAWPLTVQG